MKAGNNAFKAKEYIDAIELCTMAIGSVTFLFLGPRPRLYAP